MRTTRVRRSAAAGIAVAALLPLTGCGGSTGAGTAPESTPASSEPANESDTASPTPTPEESASPSAVPAAGIALESGGVSLHAPEGWERVDTMADWQESAMLPDTLGSHLLIQSITTLSPNETLGSLQQQSLDNIGPTGRPVGTVELDGVEFYRNAGKDHASIWVDELGALVGDRVVEIKIYRGKYSFPTKAERAEVVASILASVEVDDSVR